MAQQNDPRQHPQTDGAAHLIEKGWTVYDAIEHPVGTITDVDTSRDVLTIDGRPVGLGAFEVPLDLVTSAGGNEVRLSKVVETAEPGDTASLRLVDAPAQVTPASTARARGRTRSEAASTTSASATPSPAASSSASSLSTAPASVTVTSPARTAARNATSGSGRSTTTGPTPLPTDSFREFTPPYATAGADRDTYETDWGDDDGSSGWGMKKIGMTALALGGLAAAGYVMRRRARRKTRYERLMEAAAGYLGVSSKALNHASGYATDFARDRNPAWWAALATAALPLAYYAWPSSKPTYTEQAQAQADSLTGMLGEYLHSLTGQDRGWMPDLSGYELPKAADLMPSRLADAEWVPSSWRTSAASNWSMPGDWSVKPDVAVPVGLLALSALALYLARRATARPMSDARIRDVMTKKPRVIQPDATVADAAAMMRRLDVGALPVCDGSRLIGMVTDRDITTRATAEGLDPFLTPVRDVMSPGVAWATEDDPVEEAARIMREHQIRRLPIVDERHSLVGVVSLGDLATEVGDDEISGETLERISQ